VSREGRGRACGKLILLGEHAVVYGVPALVLGIGLGVTARAREADGRSLELLGRGCDPEEETGRAFAALLDEGGAPTARPNLEVRVEGDLPPGVGLGFSAAAAVAIARAVEDLSSSSTDDRVRARATAWERVFHGNPSGVDVAAAMHGGCIRFARVDGIRRVDVRVPLTLCVGLTGTRSSTREMVEGVARLSETNPELHRRSLEGIRSLVENAISAVEAGDVTALGELMNLNQMLLAGLMLSNETIEELCRTAREAGALGAKLTGAGGGGAVVAVCKDRQVGEGVVGAWRDAGYQGFVTELGGS
jgi:mevalonate kinase